jgi:DNA polymerase
MVKCRPPGNRDPEPAEIAACRPFLSSQLDLVDPKVVVTLGAVAARAMLGTTEGVRTLRGRTYPFRRGLLVPTYHPAAALRGSSEVLAAIRADLVRAKRALS